VLRWKEIEPASEVRPLTDCVFCARLDQPPPLIETSRLYLMPDKFPLTPGHSLIISKQHLACYGEADEETLDELETLLVETRQFLGAAYGKPVIVWENGVSGQSVFHAHLHLIPMAVERLPIEFDGHPDVTTIADWSAVRQRYRRDGSYRYAQLGADRRLVAGHSPVMAGVGRLIAGATGLRRGPAGWIKTTTADDVADVGRRFSGWRG
jgi:diadenosine tetraphosphate (Ap4A) HIT family hydrolase